MAKTMYIDETTYVEVAMGADECCDFIKNHADDEDKERIRNAILGAPSNTGLGGDTLEADIKREIATKIVQSYSLQELFELEKEILKEV